VYVTLKQRRISISEERIRDWTAISVAGYIIRLGYDSRTGMDYYFVRFAAHYGLDPSPFPGYQDALFFQYFGAIHDDAFAWWLVGYRHWLFLRQ
jgi:hypothetical protein